MTPRTTRWLGIVGSLMLAAYPVFVYIGLDQFEPRWLALIVPLTMLAAGSIRKDNSPITLAGIWIVLPVGLFVVLTLITNEEWALRLYPVMMNSALAATFLHSLSQPVTLIERLARLTNPELPAQGVIYCRQVTWVWGIYLSISTAISLWTALFASREIWVLYNGLISYVCIGVLFAVEMIVRKKVSHRFAPVEETGSR